MTYKARKKQTISDAISAEAVFGYILSVPIYFLLSLPLAAAMHFALHSILQQRSQMGVFLTSAWIITAAASYLFPAALGLYFHDVVLAQATVPPEIAVYFQA